MLGTLVLWAVVPSGSALEFDEWAKSRDVESIERHASGELAGKFQFLKGSGAFGVGQRGWRAESLADPVGHTNYVVFTAALTTQDYGDQVFEERGGHLQRLIHERESRGVRLRAADITIRFDVPKKSTTMSALVTLEKESGAGESFFIRLGDNYKVSSVTDAAARPVRFAQAGGVVSLPMGTDSTFRYRLNYSGVVNRPRFAGAIVDQEVMLTNDYWWPHIGRLPLALSTTTHVPKHWSVVAQGDKISEKTEGDEKVVRYVNKMPVSYMSLSAGEFLVRDRVVDGIRYFVASRELTAEQMDDQLEFVPPVIQFFSKLYPHPYKEYGAVDTKLYGGGALEAYSYATYGTGWLPDEDAHEPSHTWWGGVIPNTYLDSFWNESFAVFSEGFYAREGSIGDVAAKRRAFVSPANASPAYNRGTPFSSGAESGGIASLMGYGKGGDVLQQLEFEMGTDRMTATLKKFLADRPVGEAAGWPEFEKACGSEWKWFFDQWIRREGWPVLEVGPVVGSPGQGLIKISQKAPFYRFKLEVAVKGQDGWKNQLVDVMPLSTGESVIKVDLPSDWEMISLDPYDRLLQPRRPGQPLRWAEGSRRMKVYDPLNLVEDRNEIESLTDDLNGVMIIGDPGRVSEAAKWWAMTPFQFSGAAVQLDGKSVDLDSGGAVAMVEFEPGKFLGLRCGKIKHEPKTGLASSALVDRMGRFLTGRTVPRNSGPLVIRRP